MANKALLHVEAAIEALLQKNAQPSRDDWRMLIEQYPEHVDDIVDAAVLSGSRNSDSEAASDEAFFDKELFDQTISRVITLVHKTPSPLLVEVTLKVEKIQGPTVKRVANAIGIGPYPSLLSGVLVGRTLAPRRIYEVLAEYLDAPASALSEVFRRNFALLSSPAFKAPEGHPTVRTEPCGWEEAVIGLKLPASETERLIRLAD